MRKPVKNLKLLKYSQGDVTQWFGENPQLYARFELKGHNGIDIVRPHGEIMYATEAGTIVNTKDTPEGFGIHLRLISDNKNERGYYHEWTYGHCSKLLVKQGDHVEEGQAIALMGNTGFVVSGNTPFWASNPYRGTHLHLGLREVKRPKTGGWTYEGSKVRLSVVNSGNGYKGAIDPLEALWGAEDGTEEDIWRQSALTVISLANTLLNLLRK